VSKQTADGTKEISSHRVIRTAATRYPHLPDPGTIEHMHGIRVTLQPPDDAPFVEDAVLTLATGTHGGDVFSGKNGFWIEVVGAIGDDHRIAGFGWPDGDREHTVTSLEPITM
jgi:hypothetical protein